MKRKHHSQVVKGVTIAMVALFAAAMMAAAVYVNYSQEQAASPALPAVPEYSDVIIAAAGDISCDPLRDPPADAQECHSTQTAQLLDQIGPDAVLTLGDNQYETGSLSHFQVAYQQTWGKYKDSTYPAPGNHEYETPGAKGYFDYFGARAGDPAKGYYSFNLGEWHIVSLNSNCGAVPCAAGSEQEQWLRQDLTDNVLGHCILAYWHHPRFSSGEKASDVTAALWQALDEAGADVVLTGHDHTYERFAPVDPAGNLAASGIRSFIAGTGGRSLYPFTDIHPASEFRYNDNFGVLRMGLADSGYSWEFMTEDGGVVDSGSAECR